MKTATVRLSELGNDWRVEAHVEPSLETVSQATIAGAKCGLKGTQEVAQNPWAKHGSTVVKQAFQDAYSKGLQLRRKFLKEIKCQFSS